MSRRVVLPALAALAILAGCATAVPSPPASTATSGSPTPAPAPDASAGPDRPTATPALALPDAGRPYDAEELLDAMRDSRRPGGVPGELQDTAIASALAERVWTIDGRPWDTISAGGSCGPEGCTIELSGSTATASGEDLWVFSVEPATGRVELVTADLHAIPDEVAVDLDRLARAADAEGILQGLLFTSARWLPPPAEHRFALAYRSGDEEESCAVDLELDAAAGRVTDVARTGC